MGTNSASVGRRPSVPVSIILNLSIYFSLSQFHIRFYALQSDIAAECGCKALQKVQDFDAVLTAKLTIRTVHGQN